MVVRTRNATAVKKLERSWWGGARRVSSANVELVINLLVSRGAVVSAVRGVHSIGCPT